MGVAILGWSVRLVLGSVIALPYTPHYGLVWLPVFAAINAIGLHVAQMVYGKAEPGTRQGLVYVGLLLGALAVSGTVVYAAPRRGCQGCLDSGQNPTICYLTYGISCLG